MSRSFRDSDPAEPTPAALPEETPPPPAAPSARVVRIGRVRVNRWVAIAAAVAALLIVAVLVRSGGKKGLKASEVPFEPVSLRDIALTVDATGTVEPIDLIEVKSKASGQIVRMPVDVGSNVRQGDLLAQIDQIGRASCRERV